ncbi:MAG TPA: tripartite tricarboxylate transporter substrate binding protein [Burkholderiales bacterium]|nr:tripartite tricarboxylate transporter substrate binding protein [Burkholderiales bacterium]
MRSLSRIACCALFMMAVGPSSVYAASPTDKREGGPAYPIKPIRWIIDFPAAGVSDQLARTVGQRLAENLGQPIVFDNRPGANGIIANSLVAKSPPDGYTLGFISQPFSLQFTEHAKHGLRVDDFAAVGLIAEYPSLILVHPGVPVSNLKEFVAYAKKKSPPPTYASSGAGGAQHLAMEVFKKMAGFDAVHIPYSGSAPGLLDVMGGRVDSIFANLPGALPHIRAGRVKALAIAGKARNRVIADVPTFAEAGWPFDAPGYAGAVFPARVPAPLIKRMNAEIVRVLNLPEVQERILNAGCEARTSTPEAFAKFLREDIARWTPVIKAAGMTAQN